MAASRFMQPCFCRELSAEFGYRLSFRRDTRGKSADKIPYDVKDSAEKVSFRLSFFPLCSVASQVTNRCQAPSDAPAGCGAAPGGPSADCGLPMSHKRHLVRGAQTKRASEPMRFAATERQCKT